MSPIKRKQVQAKRRALMQTARYAVRDVYDAVVELVTNADDRYQLHGGSGLIEIETERRRGREPAVLCVRDHADGMDSATMESKLSWMGGRESGLAEGEDVRGTHSRGAKDVVALGHVTFESIAGDGRYHKCEITPYLDFDLHDSQEATPAIRAEIGIPTGTGTLVSIRLSDRQSMPHQSTLEERIGRLVSLREILRDTNRTVILRDRRKGEEQVLSPPHYAGKERLKQTLEIPGYEGVTAKLIICRSAEPFEKETQSLRVGGILVESRRAVHEATLFDSSLETNPHALHFYGRLVCPHIDQLGAEFDEAFEQRTTPGPHNPTDIVDPNRRSGLIREHPFVKALYGEALKRLRPLVMEEQQRAENQRVKVESAETRKRLDALEKAAMEFIDQYEQDEDTARDPDGKSVGSRFLERGYSLSPPFCQLIRDHSRQFWLNIRQEAFPELAIGEDVLIECLSDAVSSDRRQIGLESHPTREGVLRAVWQIHARHVDADARVRVRVGSITAEARMEVLDSEADAYKDVTSLRFKKKQYSMRTDQHGKHVTVLAPLAIASTAAPFEAHVSNSHFKVSGQLMLKPRKSLSVAMCTFSVKPDGQEARGVLVVRLGESEASADLVSHIPLGANLSIKLADIDLGNQRYRWRHNELDIAAQHPALKRYLGSKADGFPGQEMKHFRAILAEVVADAICAEAVARNVERHPDDYADADWDFYYSVYSKFLTEFLPKAHELCVGDV